MLLGPLISLFGGQLAIRFSDLLFDRAQDLIEELRAAHLPLPAAPARTALQ
jgi:hypothetical protein